MMAVISGEAEPPEQGGYKYQIFATFLANLGVASCGFHYAWSSPNLPKLFAKDSGYNISSADGSWIVVAPLLGNIAGAFFAAYIVDIIGRKKSIIGTIPGYMASWLLIAFGHSFWYIILGRFIGGFTDGITYTAVPMYLAEIADPKIRGTLGSLVTVTMIFAQLFVNAVAPYLSITTMALMLFMIPVTQLCLCAWIVESPYYYLMEHDVIGAEKSLKYFRDSKHVDAELKELEKAVQRQMGEKGAFKDLVVVPGNRKALLICMGLRTFQQLSGISCILFYIQYIFTLVKAPISPVITTIIFLSIQLVLSTCSSLLLDRLGRKFLFTISGIGCAIPLAITGFYFYFLTETDVDVTEYYLVPIIAMCGYIFSYSVGMAVIPITVISEMFPANVKAKALAFMDMYFSLIVCILTKLFQILSDYYGMHVPFLFFSVCGIGGVIFSTCYLPETKQKSLEEIQGILRGKKGIVNENYDPNSVNRQ